MVLQSMEDMKITNTIPLSASSQMIPGLLQSEKKTPQDILSNLEHLISYSDSPESEPEYLLPALDEIGSLALVSHSVVAYLNHLRRNQLIRVTSKVIGDTNRWLSHLFRFLDSSVSYHNDNTESILRALRLAIVSRCPRYLEAGVQALVNPSLYVSENGSMLSLQFACRQLGLSLDCIRLVPCNTKSSGNGGAVGTMDVSVLQKLILADLANNRIPLMVIADVGASVCGYVDNIFRMYEICKAQNVWLHCRGQALAVLATAQGSGEVSPCFCG